ncbi:hypothetical protein AVEN_23910-1 [Araneus ventricosus]|uniref:Uncharacterized protein n=1 Tax=Araneus ventricosus TaxID=182803 RepID=A0A4Y2WK25_ARAVE|nr:hypothetical protein AVEN_23910-1 [Araneus ventricosus]
MREMESGIKSKLMVFPLWIPLTSSGFESALDAGPGPIAIEMLSFHNSLDEEAVVFPVGSLFEPHVRSFVILSCRCGLAENVPIIQTLQYPDIIGTKNGTDCMANQICLLS